MGLFMHLSAVLVMTKPNYDSNMVKITLYSLSEAYVFVLALHDSLTPTHLVNCNATRPGALNRINIIFQYVQIMHLTLLRNKG